MGGCCVVCFVSSFVCLFSFFGVNLGHFLANSLCKMLLFISVALIQDSPTFLRHKKTFYNTRNYRIWEKQPFDIWMISLLLHAQHKVPVANLLFGLYGKDRSLFHLGSVICSGLYLTITGLWASAAAGRWNMLHLSNCKRNSKSISEYLHKFCVQLKFK